MEALMKDKIFTPGPNHIFVFGSNLSGIHGAGAAKTALDLYGAVWEQGEGLQGSSYAIPMVEFLTTTPVDDGPVRVRITEFAPIKTEEVHGH
jgi:hypothetical protein